ncbi:winged helix-turn-helix domain-containing protein [Roseateles saccharophilus]|uniref:Putative ATPase n=2 Tax=Roseateles saccharophilus TaxID=304 RepID=A0A4R3U7M7_ROSSA|nr:putative ATPase [Roseateles saccharophilus]
MPPRRSYQFGSFRLDAGGRVLYRDGQRVALTPKAIDVLIALIEARDRSVGKDELLRTVWAGTVVEEGSLTSHVSLLRKALGDDSGRDFIETLPKRGYRFIGQVVQTAPPAGPADIVPRAGAADARALLAVLPFEHRGGLDAHPDFGDGLTEEVLTQLARLRAPRLGLVATGDETAVSHRLEGSVRGAGDRVRISVQLVRPSDRHPLWAESYERPLRDVLALQSDIARAIVLEVKGQLAPLRTLTFLLVAMEEGAALGEAEAGQATRQDALLREAIARHGGRMLRAVEDALCFVFPQAGGAVGAVVEAQRTLFDEPWERAVRPVRMGVHSGTVEDADDGELGGPTVARAARVVAAAQGGQILVTAATLALLDEAAPPGGEWRDLGDHTLRGFVRPERLYQLTVAGLRSEFPPIRTPEAMRTNLPPSLTMFVGRQQALAQLRELLRRSRMVTLTGAGGVGKTRLSLEAAGLLVDDFPDGVWLVELASLADAALVPRVIASALGARGDGDTPPMTLIQARLRGKRVLLVLDNCEHVLDEAAQVAQTLLRALPQTQLLATSRQALGVEGETVFRVPSLTLPGSNEMSSATPPDVLASEAGQLFVERAAAVQPDFALTDRNAAAVAQLCRRLDGIPLAIELATARLTALSVEEVAQRLDDRFSLLTGGLRTALPRQRTLRALVDWSYELLPGSERAVLDALAVFAGGFSLEAAERVCADGAEGDTSVFDAIGQLAAKSLLIAEMHDGSGTRYRLLETIRQYAGEKLIEGGRAETVRQRHFDHFVDLATTGASALGGPTALEWLDRLEAEHDNLRAALDWSGGTDPAGYARLAGALRLFWDIRGHYTEGWMRLGRALALHTARDHVRLHALIGAGQAAHRLAHEQRSDDLLNEATALAQELGSIGSEAEATLCLADVRKFSPAGPDASEPLLLRGLPLARAAGDHRLETLILTELGEAAKLRGQYAKAQSLFLESVKCGSDAGCVIDTPTALHHAGQCALEQLDFAAARRLLGDALVQHRRNGNQHDAAQTLNNLGQLALNEHRLDEARALSSESLRIFRGLHDPKCSAKTAIVHATVLNAIGDGVAALPHAESAAETYRGLALPQYRARALCTVGCIHASLGQADAARRALFDGLAEQQRAGRDAGLPDLLEMIAVTHADDPLAAQLLGTATALRERLNIPLLPSERTQCERRHADVRARHTEAAFERAFALGNTRTRDDAIRSAFALQRRLPNETS